MIKYNAISLLPTPECPLIADQFLDEKFILPKPYPFNRYISAQHPLLFSRLQLVSLLFPWKITNNNSMAIPKLQLKLPPTCNTVTPFCWLVTYLIIFLSTTSSDAEESWTTTKPDLNVFTRTGNRNFENMPQAFAKSVGLTNAKSSDKIYKEVIQTPLARL